MVSVNRSATVITVGDLLTAKPIVCECKGNGVTLIAHLGVRGVWQPQVEALFDVQVTDTDAPSCVDKSVSSILAAAEEKMRK